MKKWLGVLCILVLSALLITVKDRDSQGENGISTRFVQVKGYVEQEGNVPYREGMTLLQAIVAAGDIKDFGSRTIRLTRDGKTGTYDYFNARDREILLKPGDSLLVPLRDPISLSHEGPENR